MWYSNLRFPHVCNNEHKTNHFRYNFCKDAEILISPMPSQCINIETFFYSLMMVWTRLIASLCFFFQKTASVLAQKLSRLFRRLLRCGESPMELRIADLAPIPKGPLSALVFKYRPISIIRVLSKVFEVFKNQEAGVSGMILKVFLIFLSSRTQRVNI